LGRAWAEPFFSASALLEALAAVVEAVEAVGDAGIVGRHGGDHELTLVVRERARRRLARRGSAHVLPKLGEAVLVSVSPGVTPAVSARPCAED
ncbi:hypothetical protein M885DRAFT_529812, partial [Pelagophyceae sp. CCMP2097]